MYNFAITYIKIYNYIVIYFVIYDISHNGLVKFKFILDTPLEYYWTILHPILPK